MNASRQAVVIGGGITGVLTAHQLLTSGWSVTLLEGHHIGAGSSSRTAAGIRQQFSTAATVLGMRYSVDFYREFTQHVGGTKSPLVQNGYLFLSSEEEAWASARQRVELQQSLGLKEVVALTGPALKQRFPWVDTDVIRGGTWCPTDGFLFPSLIYQETAKAIRELGGVIVQNAPVTGGVLSGDTLQSVTTPKGTYSGDLFIDCTNAWTHRLASILGGSQLPVSPLKRYLWFVARDGGMSSDDLMKMPLVISPDGVYGRPENGDTLLMGWKHQTEAELDFSYEDQDHIEPDYSHNTGLDALPFEAWMRLAEAVPPIGEFAGVTATTSGYYGTTPDHNPFLGFDPQRPNLLRLVGFSGHGAMFGPFTARIASQFAEAGKDLPALDLPQGPVALAEFKIGRTYGHAETMVI